MPTAPWFNLTAGTFVIEMHWPQGLSSMAQILSLNDGRTGDDQSSVCLRVNSGGSNIVAVAKVPGQINTNGANKLSPTAPFRAALAYDAAGCYVTYDGNSFSNVGPAQTHLFNKLAIGSEVWAPASGVPLNGIIRDVTYYPWRMTPAERVAATTLYRFSAGSGAGNILIFRVGFVPNSASLPYCRLALSYPRTRKCLLRRSRRYGGSSWHEARIRAFAPAIPLQSAPLGKARGQGAGGGCHAL